MNNQQKKKRSHTFLFLWLINLFSIVKIKKLIRFSLLIFLNLILFLFIVIIALIYSPGFQTTCAKYAAKYLTDYTRLYFSIDKISIDLSHKIHLQNFLVKDDKKDTMIYLDNLDINILYSSIFHKKFIISKIDFNNPKINIVRHKNDKYFNYEKLIEAFKSKDTTSKKDTNYFDIKIKSIELKNATIIYKDEKYNTKTSEQINYDFLKITNTNLVLDKIKQSKNTIYVEINQFSGKEQSGFTVKQLQAYLKITPTSLSFKNLNLKTLRSNIKSNLLVKYPSFYEFIDNPQKNMFIDAELKSSKIDFTDLTHFSKELQGWNNYIDITGRVYGTIPQLKIENAQLNYAGTEINGNLEITGLPDIDNMFFNIEAHSMVTTAQAIEKIPLYPFYKNEFIELPKQFDNAGISNFKGNIKGHYYKMKINGVLVTEIGSIKLNTLLTTDSSTNDLNYNGDFNFIDFHFGKFFQQKHIGTLNARIILNGKGTIFKTMTTSIQTQVNRFDFNNYTYRNIIIDAKLDKKLFKGDLSSADTNAQLLFSGQINFDNKIPDMNFIISMEKLNLNKLNFIKDEKNGNLSGSALIKVSGDVLDNLTGEIDFNNILYTTSEKVYFFSNSKIKMNQTNDHHKTFYFHSNFFDIDIEGRFQLSKTNNYISHFLQAFYPSFADEECNYKEIDKDTFLLSMKIKNFEPISSLLTNNQLFIQPHTKLTAHYHPRDAELIVNLQSDKISYSNILYINNKLKINSKNQQLNAVLHIDKIKLSDSLLLQNISMCSHSRDNIAKTNIEWQTVKDSIKYTYNGQIGFTTVFYKHAIYVIPDAFEIPTGKDKWIATQLNPIVIDTASNINFFPLKITKNNQSITIQGDLHNHREDSLNISFSNFELQQLNPLLASSAPQLKGTLNGNLTIHQTIKKPFVSSNIKINNLYVSNYFIGNINTRTAYQPLNNSLYLKGNLSYDYSEMLGTELKYLSFNGIYYMNKKDSSLDVEIEAKPFNLSILNPIMKDIMTIDYAFVNGKGKIEGTPEKPLISGNFQLTDSKIKTDYLNTYHKIIGNIEVLPTQVRFNEMKIYNYDKKELAGFLNGNIFHNNFSNMRIDFDISAKNLLTLNTNPLINPDYYGKIYTSGTIGIYGFINDMNIEANLTPKKNSKFTLSYSHAEEVGENSFIKFINPKDTTSKIKKDNNISGLHMNLILNTNPNLETAVVLNDKTGDGVKARGEGIIEMGINSFGKFEIKGEYVIQSGTYLFTLESIINKKFDIENGSKMTFVGDPYNTIININANYIQKASLAPLFPYDSSGTYKRRYPVKTQLSMSGKIMSPDIKFNIDIQQVDAATKSKTDLLLSDENELNRQFFSLLLLKSFVTPLQYANAGGVSAGSALAANSSEMLSNKLNSALKGISNFVDLGINYNPGSQNSSQQMELTMSKQMFNNRLSIDGSFGVNSNQTQNTSQIIGDVNIEYKLTESGKYILKAFNRTNNNTQMTISGGPYTQGVGIGYRYEFNSLFNRKNKKETKEEKEKGK